MTECILCFQRERWTMPDGSIHYHKQEGVQQILCGSCTQKAIRLSNKIPWDDGDFKKVTKPKVHGYRRRT